MIQTIRALTTVCALFSTITYSIASMSDICVCATVATYVSVLEQGIASRVVHTSARPDNVECHRNNLERIQREIIGFRPIEKPSGKTVITKSCGITDI